jgi:hypothetical protein
VWLDKEPADVAEAAENEEAAQHALITRLQKATDSRKKYEMHSIIIQSPQLKVALADILQDYPDLHCELRRLEFEAPFRLFVHRWPQLLAFRTCEVHDLERNKLVSIFSTSWNTTKASYFSLLTVSTTSMLRFSLASISAWRIQI